METTFNLTPTSSLLAQQFPGQVGDLIPFLLDPSITDIFVNGHHSIWIEKNGVLEETPLHLKESLIWDLVERMMLPLQRRLSSAFPFADGTLSDGSRFHIVLPPTALPGPSISIRKHAALEKGQNLSWGTDPSIGAWLERQFMARKNILIAGATGAGKTTLARQLLAHTDRTERVVILEESRELTINHPHVLSLEARPTHPELAGEIPLRTLLKQALRMRPNRIVLGECRGEEAVEWVHAMNTGHRGTLTTVHANSALQGLRRMENLIRMGLPHVNTLVIRENIASTLEVIVFVQQERGMRRIDEMVTLHGLEGEVIRYNVIVDRHTWIDRSEEKK